ncbi:winged helix-turn-helix transcriptional regulator [Arcobacter porcinus]|uniref:HTH-type transcriptional activator HxlR n=1 Tax=Arcobacter porcinus TaxID=1935204 RepID=A0A1C0B053_9BACT|nr:helix-turn-helix domain-containing protein [Arcobacter porcinus]OCL96842.1 HTH-type transcriptional activator HxlR [Aliarcobacter thereius]OCL82871.1 HTH-type transcriptional activator HxlR [Arcobacter porcinus]OCL85024.1 HTH-type transcriptional activator HxlR [Arcobacter porcinus]OCL86574.1 HTH-type transcriptional activator HxlR [Arcobacter porcinus]OCL93090.1 HTH-type transcriptional activator HxlR [Arcobacter porcinus]
MIELNGKKYICPSQIPIHIVDDKWKFLIIWYLASKPLRVSELSQKINDISQRTLSRKLKDLEEASLVKREVFAEVPPKVEYSLTNHGVKLLEIFNILSTWGEQYAKDMGAKLF